MQILHWPINLELQKETELHYRTQFAQGLASSDPDTIIKRITFDDVAPNLTISDLKKLLDKIIRNFLPGLSGTGLEVGAGPGTFSSVLASYPSVTKVYAVEVCPPIVELLTPKVSNYILKDKTDKVVGVVGDFDHLQIPDTSLDFIFDYYSLHHSTDLNVTLKELARVLKTGGFVLCFDKARPDYYNENDLNQLLDAEYSAQDKTNLFGVPANQSFTRRMNGEKEYRLKDWKKAFLENGFSRFNHFYLSKTVGGSSLTRFIKNALSCLPPRIQIPLARLLPVRSRSHRFILSGENRIFMPPINLFPKEFSLLIAYK